MLYDRRGDLGFGFGELLDVARVSRQSFYGSLAPSGREALRTGEEDVLALAREVRRDFLPGSSSRQVYNFIRRSEAHTGRLRGWGRDAFEALCLKKGFRVEFRRYVPKTTQRGDFVFPNLLEGLSITNINQVWVSDICYVYGSEGKLLGYATTLMDLYSRRLLGLSFSQTMHAAVTSQEVLRQAFIERCVENISNVIFHSDAGKQYIEGHFLQLLRDKSIRSSMAENCYENAFAEALNDTLKNHMLHDLNLNSHTQLKKHEKFIKKCYNEYKPHGGLKKMTPAQYEVHILALQPDQRTKLLIRTLESGKTPKNQFENKKNS
jgi:transposase InsO family protein